MYIKANRFGGVELEDMSELEVVIVFTRKIETFMEKRLGASGRGLHEKTTSIEHLLHQDLIKKLRKIASIRNAVLHDDDYRLESVNSFARIAGYVLDDLEEICQREIFPKPSREFVSQATIGKLEMEQQDATHENQWFHPQGGENEDLIPEGVLDESKIARLNAKYSGNSFHNVYNLRKGSDYCSLADFSVEFNLWAFIVIFFIVIAFPILFAPILIIGLWCVNALKKKHNESNALVEK